MNHQNTGIRLALGYARVSTPGQDESLQLLSAYLAHAIPSSPHRPGPTHSLAVHEPELHHSRGLTPAPRVLRSHAPPGTPLDPSTVDVK